MPWIVTVQAGSGGTRTGRHRYGAGSPAALLRAIDAASLFLVPLDEERTVFRYHHLVRQLLRAELRARNPEREQALQQRAGECFEGIGDIRPATRHFFAARQADRALTLLQDHVLADYQRDPAMPPPPDLSTLDPALLAGAPDRLLALALDLVLSGRRRPQRPVPRSAGARPAGASARLPAHSPARGHLVCALRADRHRRPVRVRGGSFLILGG